MLRLAVHLEHLFSLFLCSLPQIQILLYLSFLSTFLSFLLLICCAIFVFPFYPVFILLFFSSILFSPLFSFLSFFLSLTSIPQGDNTETKPRRNKLMVVVIDG